MNWFQRKPKLHNAVPWRLYSPSWGTFACHGTSFKTLEFYSREGAEDATGLLHIRNARTDDWRPVNVESFSWKLKTFWFRLQFAGYFKSVTRCSEREAWSAAFAAEFPQDLNPKEAADTEISYMAEG